MKSIMVGDKIIIKKGMLITAKIPEKFINTENPFSSKEYFTLITVGNIYERKNISKQEIFNEFKRRMDDFFFLTDYEINKIIDSHPLIFSPLKYYTDYYAGIYIVTSVEKRLIGDEIISARKTSDDSIMISFSTEYNSDIEIVS